jgi:hypothetical protein
MVSTVGAGSKGRRNLGSRREQVYRFEFHRRFDTRRVLPISVEQGAWLGLALVGVQGVEELGNSFEIVL